MFQEAQEHGDRRDLRLSINFYKSNIFHYGMENIYRIKL